MFAQIQFAGIFGWIHFTLRTLSLEVKLMPISLGVGWPLRFEWHGRSLPFGVSLASECLVFMVSLCRQTQGSLVWGFAS